MKLVNNDNENLGSIDSAKLSTLINYCKIILKMKKIRLRLTEFSLVLMIFNFILNLKFIIFAKIKAYGQNFQAPKIIFAEN